MRHDPDSRSPLTLRERYIDTALKGFLSRASVETLNNTEVASKLIVAIVDNTLTEMNAEPEDTTRKLS